MATKKTGIRAKPDAGTNSGLMEGDLSSPRFQVEGSLSAELAPR
jgi:hypothetical protein